MITRVKATNYRCFSTLNFKPNQGMNVIVGDNEAGKSTLLEIISLVLTGRVRGRSIADDLNPYWFNLAVVKTYFELLRADPTTAALPALELEVYFDVNDARVARLRGLHNSEGEDCPGLKVAVVPDPERETELNDYLASPDIPELIPTDLLTVIWRDFAGETVTRSPRSVSIAVVDGSTVASATGIDYKLRQLLRDFVSPAESARIALSHRTAKAHLTEGVLAEVNKRIEADGNSFGVGLQMDQSAATNWDVAVVPHMGSIPFSMLGHGRQVATKVELALNRTAESTHIVLVEEPENHMSHTRLQKLLGAIESHAGERQLFISTHSSFVLNRLGFGSLHLLHDAAVVHLDSTAISDDTISYFRKQSGYDTLRLAIATKVVVVEGPSDEMIFNLAFLKLKGVEPRAKGIDVVTLGTQGKRALELAHALGKRMAVVRDNDGRNADDWKADASQFLLDGERELFVSDPAHGKTLEPQIIEVGNDSILRQVLRIADDVDLLEYMAKHKTDWAWRVAEAQADLQWPDYIQQAIEFIDGD